MNNTYLFISILIMILVTYIPRSLPILLIKKKFDNKFVKSFFYYVPYTVLASLTFPSILYFTDSIYLSIVGTLSSLIISLITDKMYVTVGLSVVIVYVLSFII